MSAKRKFVLLLAVVMLVAVFVPMAVGAATEKKVVYINIGEGPKSSLPTEHRTVNVAAWGATFKDSKGDLYVNTYGAYPGESFEKHGSFRIYHDKTNTNDVQVGAYRYNSTSGRALNWKSMVDPFGVGREVHGYGEVNIIY